MCAGGFPLQWARERGGVDVHQHHIGCTAVVLVGNITHLMLGGAVNESFGGK